MADSFVGLHNHTLFSKQDAVIKINELVDKVVEYGQSAIAITDHSSTAGHWYLKQACLERDVKPIYGNEFYTNDSYENKTRNRNHLLCLGMNDIGIININRLQDMAVRNSYYKPIVSLEELPKYTEGIFATSACSLGSIPQAILNNDMEKAEELCNWFTEIFNNNFALELQYHPQFAETQNVVNDGVIELSDKTGIPLIVTSDAHFLTEDDADVRRVIQAIAWHSLYKDVNPSLPSNCLGNSEIILKNAEMSGADLDVTKKAIKHTSVVADKCNGDLCSSDRKVPVFDKFEQFDKLFKEIL